jgi:saccharopine dehydrogenase-like NADP-dependent oxidoreductase
MQGNGLFEPEKIKQTAESLFKEWAPRKEDFDQTIMRLEFIGKKDGEKITEIYNLLDYFDEQKNITSMARTTGYTCAAVANIILSGDFKKNGVFTLENFGRETKLVDNILHYLSERNIQFN